MFGFAWLWLLWWWWDCCYGRGVGGGVGGAFGGWALCGEE